MAVRQFILKLVYPALMKAGKWLGVKAKVEINENDIKPVVSFYTLKAFANDGTQIDFDRFKGKKVLVVNTASDCGYTRQYAELEKLNKLYKGKVAIIGFPANDFKEQERGTDSEIAEFCKTTFAIQFLLMQKSSVVKGGKQNEIYQWLTDKNKNGWNEKQSEWNFSKYLVNEYGVLTHYFGPAISPLSDAVTRNLE